ncbi:MAG: diacylglycerol kinase family lipid kinase [Deltaproteobacteria bacterium]|nr:diacylglycerol kinase family lipid kinase [Deltaproteobacteria bacterium]
MKVFVIANPIAGGGRGERLTQDLFEALGRNGYQVDGHLTRSAGEAGAQARDLATDFEALVIVGGDGTINEVLNGLKDPSQTPLAVLPAGTANILARELSLSDRPAGLVRTLKKGVIRRIDMGLIGKHRFLMVASAGFDAFVTEEVRRRRKKSLGFRRYLLPILSVLMHYRPPDLTVTVDGGEAVRGSFVVVSNTKIYGGIFSFADRAQCDSGHLDICVFPRGDMWALLRYYVAAYRRRVSSDTDVRYCKGKRILIESKEPAMIQVDGEPFGTTPSDIRIVPSCVPIKVPPAGDATHKQ